MTGWIIFGCILLVLIWLFTRSVTVTAIYDKSPELRVRFLFFTIVKVPPDREKQRKKEARKKAKQEKLALKEAKKAAKLQHAHGNRELLAETDRGSDSEAQESGASARSEQAPEENAAPEENSGKTAKAEKVKKPKKKMPAIDFNMIRDYINSASPPIKRLFSKIRIRDLYIDWVVGSDDAAVTALKYGGICSAVYSGVEFLKYFFSTDVKEINIEADFSAEKDDIFAYVTVKLRVSTAIGCALWLAFRVLRTYLKYNKAPAKAKHRPVRA